MTRAQSSVWPNFEVYAGGAQPARGSPVDCTTLDLRAVCGDSVEAWGRLAPIGWAFAVLLFAYLTVILCGF